MRARAWLSYRNSSALIACVCVQQYAAIERKIGTIIEAAGEMGVNVLCLQEAWTMPFAFCTREKHWNEFAEDCETGRSTKFLSGLARKLNMVIVSPILERDSVHFETVWNTVVIISNHGEASNTRRGDTHTALLTSLRCWASIARITFRVWATST